MKLQIQSDLHLESPKAYDVFEIVPGAPYLALLGDIGTLGTHKDELLAFLTTQLKQFRALATLGLAASLPQEQQPKMTRRHRDVENVPLNLLSRRMACGEGAQRVCYGGSTGGTSQNLDPEDLEYAAAYLRHLADTNDNPIWNIPAEFDCSEWTLPLFGAGTVMALAKHINPRTNSGVTYHDLARTIDGGEGATQAQRAASLLGGCGKNGGQLGVIVDASNPAYTSAKYVAAKMKPQDIIVKVVRDPNFPALV